MRQIAIKERRHIAPKVTSGFNFNWTGFAARSDVKLACGSVGQALPLAASRLRLRDSTEPNNSLVGKRDCQSEEDNAERVVEPF